MHDSETAFCFFWAAGVFVDKQLPGIGMKLVNFIRSFHLVMHPASRASFCLFLYWGGEKEALPESRQLFEAAAARTSGLVNLVFSRQTGFSSGSIRVVIKPMELE